LFYDALYIFNLHFPQQEGKSQLLYTQKSITGVMDAIYSIPALNGGVFQAKKNTLKLATAVVENT
jgi:hypothetical protein